MNEEDTMMNLMGVRRGPMQGPPQPLNLDDPANIDWGALASQYQLSPEEVQMLQIPGPEQGPSLADRLQALRPQMNMGGMNIRLEDNGISGKLRF